MTPRRLISLSVILAAATGLAAVTAAHAKPTKVAASPKGGHPATRVDVTFKSPYVVYGSDTDEYERYRVTLFPPRGCGSGRLEAITSGVIDPGTRVSLGLRPRKGRFCPGVWRGKVTYEEYLADTEEDCSAAEAPESGSSQCEYYPTGTYTKVRLPVGSFKVRVR
jgi:hypothetical protein